MYLQAAGKYKQKGREYVVEDGDILYIKFNAGAGLTGKKKQCYGHHWTVYYTIYLHTVKSK